MKKIIVIVMLLIFPVLVNAKEITSTSRIKLGDSDISTSVLDNNESTYISIRKNQIISISSDSKIQGIYLIYELNGGKGSISSGELTTTFGDNGFIHDYINVEELFGDTSSIQLKYSDKATLTDIYVIGEGEIPSFVEIWEAPAEKADLLLFSTHSDDEQLFFSGLLPHYVAKGAEVQVVYFTNHSDNQKRYHEQLHGLYTVGVRHYPIIGPIPDKWASSLSGALSNMKSMGFSEKQAMDFMVEVIRRFKPLVIVGHDEKGEYGHGQHMLCTYLLERAIDNANDPTYDDKTYNKYGIWSTKKVYIHLYNKNQIKMNYDVPLDYFGGKTAFQVSQDGFKKHISQQYTWFRRWLNGDYNEITKASQIQTYSPLEYGLFRSLVGPDKEKNDMFENLSFYKDITNEEEFFNRESVATIKEKPMEIGDEGINYKRLAVFILVALSGVGILFLVRKL